MSLEPQFSLLARLAKVDEVAEQDKKANHDDTCDGQLEARFMLTSEIRRIAELHSDFVRHSIIHRIEGEGGHRALTKPNVFSSIRQHVG